MSRRQVSWHLKMEDTFKEIGERLGFRAKIEYKIPRGKIDCLWIIDKPLLEYFIAFEFETSVRGAQIIQNLFKYLASLHNQDQDF